jgi:hypothetical protein
MLFWHCFPFATTRSIAEDVAPLLLSVVQHGPIRAATELGVAHTAISRQIQALEYELGPPLLE